MEYLHERGLKGYITLNTLVFSHELGRFRSIWSRSYPPALTL
jgi:collagenase-like PrtC family protease